MKRLCEALERARTTRSRLEKERVLGEALAAIAADDGEVGLALATRLMVGQLRAGGDRLALGLGGALLLDMASSLYGWPRATIEACARATGDIGEAMGLLRARQLLDRTPPGLTLATLATAIESIGGAKGRGDKLARLEALLADATALETKYAMRAMLGAMRIGASRGVVEAAIAVGFGAPKRAVAEAMGRIGEIGAVAIAAARGELGAEKERAAVRIGRPLGFMLATPLESVASAIETQWLWMEDKLDGIRVQAHKAADAIRLFARGSGEVTEAFPEVVAAIATIDGAAVIDGELVAIDGEGRVRPFAALQSRLGRKRPSEAAMRATRVCLAAYDWLADDEGDWTARPLEERRLRLEGKLGSAANTGGAGAWALRLHERRALPRAVDGAAIEAESSRSSGRSMSATELDAALAEAFAEARARGQEGLVLKDARSAYAAGRRGTAWLKVKKALATLDVVITFAERGHGRRAGILSDYTFAVWREGVLEEVGKAYSGLHDDEMRALSSRLEALALERRGARVRVRPEVVLEVAFDGVQRSARHRSGFALRFPRIVRLRDDKRAEDADGVAAVEALFASQLTSGHREEAPVPEREPAQRRRRTTRAADERQLGLFTSATPAQADAEKGAKGR
jgi:DNA ligase-1